MKKIQRVTSIFEKKFNEKVGLFNLYSAPYTSVVKKEVKLGSISKNDVILNVGCGALPFTAVQITKQTGAQVYAIDKDAKAVDAAQKIIDKMNLSHKIKVLFSDGAKNFSFTFDKSIMALQVEPKNSVLDNLLKTGGQVIMRIPRNSFKDNYGFQKLNHVPHKSVKHPMMFTFDRSVLFKN